MVADTDINTETTIRRIPIRWKLNVVGVVIILTFSLILYAEVLPLIEQEKVAEREKKLTAIVSSAISLMDFYENGIRKKAYQKDPHMPRTRIEAQLRVLNTLKQIRYDEAEHLFILDGRANMVMHPTKSDLESKDMSEAASPDGARPFYDMVMRSQKDGAAFVSYNWLSKWSRSVYEPQTTYAQYFYPWDWVVCSSVYTQDITDSVRKIGLKVSGYFLVGILIAAGLIYLLGRIIVQPVYKLSKKAEEIVDTFGEKPPEAVHIANNDEIGDLAHNFNEMTQRLHEAIGFLREQIVKRKEIENALRQSEEKYRLLIENANDAIFIAQDGVIKFPNPMALKMSGYSTDELASMPFTDIIHPDHVLLVSERYAARLKGENVPSTYAFKIVSKDREERWGQINSVLVDWEGRPAILNFLRDIDEQKQLEAKLIHAQKMESLGTLAGGIAHDFNNLLMGIQGNVSLLLAEVTKGDVSVERLESIERYVKNAAELTRQLLGIARAGKYDPKPTHLNELILNSANIFGRTKKEIVITTDLSGDLDPVQVDRGQLEQVLLNIYVNAWQAMPDGGELNITTGNITLSDADARALTLNPGRYTKTAIEDTGSGMENDTMQQIFDPFFTTKDKSIGTGLGLSSAYGIIKNHHGTITVKSEKDKGTTFYIYLPATDEHPQEKVPPKPTMRKGNEVILVVDDEALALEVAEQMLSHLGYVAIVAQSGMEALEILKQRKKDVRLVLLDMIMPKMSGSETFDAIKAIRADIKVMLASGYSLNGQAEEIMARGCDGFIQKPFNLEQLSEKLRQVLDR